ncbi:MAG: hypothetical protein ABI361_13750 [Nitrososphaera sp.]
MVGLLGKRPSAQEKEEGTKRFYALLKALMDEVFAYSQKSRHVKIPSSASFGLVYDERESILFTGIDKNTGKKLHLYNVRIIGRMFEEKRQAILEDQTTTSLLSWVADVCSIYISPFVYEYVVNVQHRGEGAAQRTTRQIVKGFMEKLTSDPELEHVLDNLKG